MVSYFKYLYALFSFQYISNVIIYSKNIDKIKVFNLIILFL